ncbi:MAG TPA: hypothetical protein VME19_16650 [Streptosporangiaceae bacterium]|nr:hypothetical protein [Streptosporangiaceae bacterium]
MMSLTGASRTVVTVLVLPDCASPWPGAALGTGAGAAAPAAGAAALRAPLDAAELDALPPEHPATNSAPPSMVPTTASPATPNRVRRARADRPFKLTVFSMPL